MATTIRQGFALPTVIVVAFMLLVISLAIIQNSLSARRSLDDQYYNQLATEAAEAGVTYANACLAANLFTPTWSDVKPLTPGTDCSGNNSGVTSTVIKNTTLQTRFSVGGAVSFSGGQRFTVTGFAELLNAAGGVYKTYSRVNITNSGGDLSINRVQVSYASSTTSTTLGSRATTFSLTSTQQVYGVGYNGDGELGDGTTTSVLTPTKFILPTGLYAKAVFVNPLSNGINAFVATSDGQLYGAGDNDWGQLGIGSYTSPSPTPQRYQMPSNLSVKSVSLLGDSTFVVTTNGQVWSAGDNTCGVLGDGTISYRNIPVKMQLPVSEVAVKVATDYYGAYVLTQSGKVYGTGYNVKGMFGPTNVDDCIMTPIQVGAFGNSGQPKATDVVTDGVSGWILNDQGDVWGYGTNWVGELGNGTYTSTYSGPAVKFNIGTEKAASISTDFWELVVVTRSGKVYGAGNNGAGELGVGDQSYHPTPVQFPLPAGEIAIAAVSTGHIIPPQPYYYGFGNNTFVLTSSGKLFAAGDNYYGQLGIGSFTNAITTPQQMIMPSGVTAKDVRGGGGTAIVLGSNNLIYSVGNNNYGQLGDGTQVNKATLTATRYLNMASTLSF